MSESMGWQEWFRKSIANKSYNPKSAAQKAWAYRGEEIKKLRSSIAALEAENAEHNEARATWRALADKLYQEVTALREAQRWVPVSEMLPKKGTRVVVYIEPVIRERAYASLKATYETGEWPFGYGNRVITHWLPLPPQPEHE